MVFYLAIFYKEKKGKRWIIYMDLNMYFKIFKKIIFILVVINVNVYINYIVMKFYKIRIVRSS